MLPPQNSEAPPKSHLPSFTSTVADTSRGLVQMCETAVVSQLPPMHRICGQECIVSHICGWPALSIGGYRLTLDG